VKKQTPEKFPSPVFQQFELWSGVVVGLQNSERSQQNRAYKYKSGAHNQDIQSPRKVHVRASLVEVRKG
jgi:hypothetical protein